MSMADVHEPDVLLQPRQVIYITAREDYAPYYRDDRKYFELDTFYAEFCKLHRQRRMPMIQQKDESAIKVYERWQELNKKRCIRYM